MKKLWWFLVLLCVILGGVWWLVKLPSSLFSKEYSQVVVDEDGEILRVFINDAEQWFFPMDDDPIPDKLIQAVITYEDKRFYHHFGVDLLAFSRAIIQNIRKMGRISGASTITMQVARLSKPKERTIGNKFIEMIQAIKIELFYTKEEIMKMYLTHAPYGGNIVGYKTASFRYFGKDPSQITWSEAAMLAVLPNSPGLINPMKGRENLQKKRDDLLKKMLQNGIIDQNTFDLAIAEEIPKRQIPFDLAAPHLTDWIFRESESRIIRTTISKKIQYSVNSIIQDYMHTISSKGVTNCAVLVVQTKTGEVKAYIGSHDYFDIENAGMVDGVQMTRSTGSVLKPFLYGLAIDEGLVCPQSKIKDIPVTYGAYTPYNASGKFSGIVTVKEALINSLNAPAVSLLDEYGVERFYYFLQKAGVESLIRSPQEYGLPLILGGAEASLWDIASLYYGLGNLGSFGKIHVFKDQVVERKNLLSPGATYLVLDMLQDVKRPGVEFFWREYASSRKLAWKTGTSYGNRDAWAVGVSPDWTIAVWVGNFDGRESKSLTGVDTAGPLLFRIFNTLDKDYYENWFPRPDDLMKIQVSRQTGYRLQEEMGELVDIYFPVSAKPLRYSPYEKVIFVNKDETEEVCSLCWEDEQVKKVLKVVYPPEVIQFLKDRGNSLYTIPPHKGDCPTVSNFNPIEFIYPQAGSIILVPRGIDGEYQKVNFRIAHSYEDSRLFWYLDSEYLGETSETHQMALSPETGWHKLHVVDALGHHREIRFYSDRK